MRAKLDENLPVEAAELLRTAGWECETVYDEGLAGADDPIVAARCQVEARVLFTLDLDFADIRAYPPSDYVGIVVLRPVEPSRREALALVSRVLPVLSADWAEHRLWIVEPSRVRVRSANDPAI
jgi:predicted nuclease of predicted toxin-antitoxin system